MWFPQAFASNARGIVQALVANVFAPSTELATGEAVLQLLRDIVRRLGANAKHIASLILGMHVPWLHLLLSDF